MYQNKTEINNLSQEQRKNLVDLYVKTQNLDALRSFITSLKAEKEGRSWYFKDYIQYAVRDAILLGHQNVVKVFLEEEFRPDTTVKSKEGHSQTLLAFAVETGSLDMVTLLVENGAEVKRSKHSQDRSKSMAMTAAVKNNNTAIALYLLSCGADTTETMGGYEPETYLARAAKNGNLGLVDALIQNGAEVFTAIELDKRKYLKLYNEYTRLLQHEYTQERQIALENDLKKDTSGFMKEYHQQRLKEFHEKKNMLVVELKQLKITFYDLIRILLDRAFGVDFPLPKKRNSYDDEDDKGLTFLSSLDVSDFNFCGISVNGVPVTREMLRGYGLQGADQAMVAVVDILKLQDTERRKELLGRLDKCAMERGRIDVDGIINLVPLWRAAEIGDETTVLVRLSAGCDPNSIDEQYFGSKKPIVSAARQGHFTIIKLLAEHPNIKKEDIVTAIELAKQNNHPEIANYLENLQDVNIQDAQGDTLLHKAVDIGDLAEVMKLLQRGADLTVKNKNYKNPFQIAAANTAGFWSRKEDPKYIDILRFIISQNPPQELFPGALEAAVKAGSPTSVELLLSAMPEKCDISSQVYGKFGQLKFVKNYPWYTDLIFDAMNSKKTVQILTILKKYGADFNALSQGNGDTLLIRSIKGLPSYSSISGSLYSVAMSIHGGEDRVGPNVLQRTEDSLIEQAKENFKKNLVLLDYLLANGANPAIANPKTGLTPLHTLVKDNDLHHLEKGYEEVIDRLLKFGANVHALDDDNCTPLFYAADTGDFIAINYLFLQGAKINVQSKEHKRTPLHQAAARCFLKTTRLLIQLGADPLAIDSEGLTPLQLLKKVQAEEFARSEFDSYKEKQEFETKYHDVENILRSADEIRLSLNPICQELDKFSDVLAFRTEEAPELLRRVAISRQLAPAEIYAIIKKVLKEEAILEEEANELLSCLAAINRLANLEWRGLMLRNESIPALVQACALKVVADKAHTPDIIARKLDLCLIKAMLDFNIDMLAKYLKDAPSLLRNGFNPVQYPHIAVADHEAIVDDLAEIKKFAAYNKQVLNLRSHLNYKPEEIARMVFAMALKAASEKASLSAKEKAPGQLPNNLQHVGGPLHERRDINQHLLQDKPSLDLNMFDAHK